MRLICSLVLAITMVVLGCSGVPNAARVKLSPQISTHDGWVFNGALFNIGDVVMQINDGSLRLAGRTVDFAATDIYAGPVVKNQLYSVTTISDVSFNASVPSTVQAQFRAQLASQFRVELTDAQRHSFRDVYKVVGSNPNNAKLKGLWPLSAGVKRALLVIGSVSGESTLRLADDQAVKSGVIVDVYGYALHVEFHEDFKWTSGKDGESTFVILQELTKDGSDVKCEPIETVWSDKGLPGE